MLRRAVSSELLFLSLELAKSTLPASERRSQARQTSSTFSSCTLSNRSSSRSMNDAARAMRGNSMPSSVSVLLRQSERR